MNKWCATCSDSKWIFHTVVNNVKKQDYFLVISSVTVYVNLSRVCFHILRGGTVSVGE